jgi:hypothetical protein
MGHRHAFLGRVGAAFQVPGQSGECSPPQQQASGCYTGPEHLRARARPPRRQRAALCGPHHRAAHSAGSDGGENTTSGIAPCRQGGCRRTKGLCGMLGPSPQQHAVPGTSGGGAPLRQREPCCPFASPPLPGRVEVGEQQRGDSGPLADHFPPTIPPPAVSSAKCPFCFLREVRTPKLHRPHEG